MCQPLPVADATGPVVRTLEAGRLGSHCDLGRARAHRIFGGRAYDPQSVMLGNVVARTLRHKLGEHGLVETVRGVGYRFG